MLTKIITCVVKTFILTEHVQIHTTVSNAQLASAEQKVGPGWRGYTKTSSACKCQQVVATKQCLVEVQAHPPDFQHAALQD